jgi:hypothetical protein
MQLMLQEWSPSEAIYMGEVFIGEDGMHIAIPVPRNDMIH